MNKFEHYLLDNGIDEKTVRQYNSQIFMFINFMKIESGDQLKELDRKYLIDKSVEFCNSKFKKVSDKEGNIVLIKISGKNRVYNRKYGIIHLLEFYELYDSLREFKKRTKGMKVIPRKNISKALTIDEYKKLVAELPEDYRFICEILFWGALRIEECLSLKRKNFEKIGDRFKISGIGKGSKIFSVFIPKDLSKKLAVYINNKCVFNQESDLFDVQYYTFRVEIKKFGKEILGKDITSHTFKHTRSQFEFNRGTPLDQIKEILHHSNINTTLIYKSESGIDSRKVIEERESEI